MQVRGFALPAERFGLAQRYLADVVRQFIGEGSVDS